MSAFASGGRHTIRLVPIKTCQECGAVSVPAQSFSLGCGTKFPSAAHFDSAVFSRSPGGMARLACTLLDLCSRVGHYGVPVVSIAHFQGVSASSRLSRY